MSGLLSAIRDELPNKEFRENYVAENVRRGLAYQIRALREARGWSPAELARQAGLPQSNISRWENPSYGKFSLSTLIEIASVFDVALSIRFVGFEELLTSLSDLRPNRLAVPSYDEEREMAQVAVAQAQERGALAAFYRTSEQKYLGASALTQASQVRGGFLPPHILEVPRTSEAADMVRR